MTERRSNGVSGDGGNGGNIGGRFGRDGMRFGWDLMAKGWSGIWFMTRPQFISGPIGITMSMMLFLEDIINSQTTGLNRLQLSLLFNFKMQQIDCTSCLHVSRPLFRLYVR